MLSTSVSVIFFLMVNAAYSFSQQNEDGGRGLTSSGLDLIPRRDGGGGGGGAERADGEQPDRTRSNRATTGAVAGISPTTHMAAAQGREEQPARTDHNTGEAARGASHVVSRSRTGGGTNISWENCG